MPTVRCVAFFATPALLSLSSVAAPPAPEPGFWLVGFPPGSTSSGVTSLTSNGGTAAGGGKASFTWTKMGGRNDFGLYPGAAEINFATGLSDNGVAVGNMWFDSTAEKSRAYRWAGSGPLQDLGVLPGETRMFASGVSGDGNVVVGYGEHGQSTALDGQAFRWTPSGGLQGLGYLYPFSINSHANGISRDGSTIVGSNLDFNLTTHAFVWKESTGMTALPGLPNPFAADTKAFAVSTDGSVVVGSADHSSQFTHAVRWVNGEIEDLAEAFGANSQALAVSSDGSVIGGSFTAAPTSLGFLWTEATGMRVADEYLALFGVTVPADYRIERIHAISGDGLTFAGEARNLTTGFREGFVATVRATGGPCKADCDDSGQLNIDDFICFQTFFALGEPKADCDQSGRLNIDDFVCFQTLFAIGC